MKRRKSEDSFASTRADKRSLFEKSALHRVIADRPIDFDEAVAVFRRESAKALSFGQSQTDISSVLRRERYKTFILKTLVYIGISSDGKGMAVLARLIEALTSDPSKSPDQAIRQFALTHSASFRAVEHIVEKHFNVYNENIFERISRLTQSQPMTPKDALCDLSAFVRMNFMQEIKL